MCAWAKRRNITFAFWSVHLTLSSWFSLWMSYFQGYDLNLNLSLNDEVHGSDIYPKPFAVHPINARWLHSCSALFKSQTCWLVCSLFSLQHNFVPSEIKMNRIWEHNNKICFDDKKKKSRGKRKGKIGNSHLMVPIRTWMWMKESAQWLLKAWSSRAAA